MGSERGALTTVFQQHTVPALLLLLPGLAGLAGGPRPKTQGPGKDARCPLNRCQALPATRASRKVSVLAAFPYHLPALQPPASQCSLRRQPDPLSEPELEPMTAVSEAYTNGEANVRREPLI